LWRLETGPIVEHKTRTIFWPLTFAFKRHYILYWILAGTLFLVLRSSLLAIYKSPIHYFTELFFAYFIVSALVATILYIGDVFDSIPTRFSKYFEHDLSEWAEREGFKIFDRRYWPMWIISIWVNVLGTITLVVVTNPSGSTVKNSLFIASVQPVFFLCGYTCYFLTALGIAGRRLVKLPLATTLLERGHRLIGTLSGYVYFLAFGGLVEYLGLLIAVRLGPTRQSSLMAPWLIGLSITPIIIFAWGIYHVHVLQREIKIRNLELLNLEVQNVLIELKDKPTKESVEKLAKMVDIQERLEGIKEWPLALGSVLTLILALAAAISQILTSLSNFFKAQIP
jgi:hypothetical protein